VLNVLHEGASTTNNLGTKIEAWNRLQANRDFLLGPFALGNCQYKSSQ
jgi:hypothetical protein